MASLRDTMETLFAAAAFAEQNAPAEAMQLLKECEERTRPTDRKSGTKRDEHRPRPSLRAE